MFIYLVLLCMTPKPPFGSDEAKTVMYHDCSVIGAFDGYKEARTEALELQHDPENAGKVGVQKVRLETESFEERMKRVLFN